MYFLFVIVIVLLPFLTSLFVFAFDFLSVWNMFVIVVLMTLSASTSLFVFSVSGYGFLLCLPDRF